MTTETIYADYQATAPMDVRVLDAMMPHWRESFGNPHSSDHVVGWRAAAAVEAAQYQVADLIGADPDEIIFTSGATESNNLALLGLARRAPANRRRILVSAIEHKCVLAAAKHLETQEGFEVDVLPVNTEGFVDLAILSAHLDDTVLLASIMAVNNEVGTIQDVAPISAILNRYGVIFHCDAAQAPTAMDVSQIARHADLVSISGHKIYGPQGIGALYIRRDLQPDVEPLVYGGEQQGGLRSGTLPLPLCVGLGKAAEIMSTPDVVDERRRVAAQRYRFVGLVRDADIQFKWNGPTDARRHPGNANLRFYGLTAADLLSSLQPGVAASTGAACTSGIPEPSHVLRAIGLTDDESDSSVRFSFGRFTTDEEIEVAGKRLLTAITSWGQITPSYSKR